MLAGCSPEPYPGINIVWDFSYLFSKCGYSLKKKCHLKMPFDGCIFCPRSLLVFPYTVGEFIEILLANLTNRITLLKCAYRCSSFICVTESNGTRVIPNNSTLDFLAGVTEDTTLYFGPAPKNGEIVRLTLFGYVFDDGGSCVLWSLDGSPNARANEKCGGEVELVCTVRLVEKELKPDCKDGYDWLGFNIAHDFAMAVLGA